MRLSPRYGETLDEFSASLVKESVGRTYVADSEEEAEWDGFLVWFGWHDVNVLRRYRCLFVGFVWSSVHMWLLMR